METPKGRQQRVGILWVERAHYAIFRALKVDPRAEVAWIYGGDPLATFARMAEVCLGGRVVLALGPSELDAIDIVIAARRRIRGVEFTQCVNVGFLSDAEVAGAIGPRGIAWEHLTPQTGAQFVGELDPTETRQRAAELGRQICQTWQASLASEGQPLLVLTNCISDYWVFRAEDGGERAAEKAFPRMWRQLLEPEGAEIQASPAEEGLPLSQEQEGWCRAMGLSGKHIYAAPVTLARSGLRAWLLVATGASTPEGTGGWSHLQAMLKDQFAELNQLAELLARRERKPHEEP